ncbi:MAG: M20/M25/M40 family metallo-hydrolase [Pseudomonadota bacterium]
MTAAERLRAWTEALVRAPGLSGHEGPVRARLAEDLRALGLAPKADVLGNLMATLPGDPARPSVMLFAHMDQLGLVVRRIEPDGFLRVERVGGVPEKALPAQAVSIGTRDGGQLPGVIGLRSHHATPPEEKTRVIPYRELYIDAGFDSTEAARAAGVEIGAPVIYAPRLIALGPHRLAGSALDDRAGCAVVLEAARALLETDDRPTVHVVFSVQEEFNLRGAVTAAQVLRPAIALQIDLALAADTPEMRDWGEVRLGGGPAIGVYSFHGRGTLNGLIPHPALVALAEHAAAAEGLPLQRSAHVGALTETSYIQLLGEGVACLDLAFPIRGSHSPLELADLRDLEGLARLSTAMIRGVGPDFPLIRDETRP